MLAYIVWDPMREIIKGIQPPVWYSVLFAAGFIIGYQIMVKIFKKEGHDPQNVDTLTVHMVLATIIGARLGHLVFYEPDRFLADPLMFFRTWEGGLASHGAAFGILVALYLYTNYVVSTRPSILPLKFTKLKRKGQSYLWVVDRIVITVALAGAFIRMGNFVNSEIIGKPTESEYGVVFGRVAEELLEKSNYGIESAEASKGTGDALTPGIVPVDLTVTFEDMRLPEQDARRVIENSIANSLRNNYAIAEHYVQPAGAINYDLNLVDRKFVAVIHTYGIARYPTQLYEAGTCVILFLILYGIWAKYKERLPEGVLLGIFLIWIFGLRWFHELFKENQVAFEDDMAFNMGQILSIPLVLLGVFILLRVLIKSKKS
ncbi:prolipoprotein diacylglyceryl transferase [Roseivirga pacifica]|uniref:prolipoprotein diacylglyceryl transferase n=1 Tax=Roseivirga pacifica TaxID=1267423 RepID=UPI00227AA76D|nr:prolipoprotein diacylglyceryl transferase [Roseivirga pacifica]